MPTIAEEFAAQKAKKKKADQAQGDDVQAAPRRLSPLKGGNARIHPGPEPAVPGFTAPLSSGARRSSFAQMADILSTTAHKTTF